jgi:nucleotide-binding universal stress UspA family protein
MITLKNILVATDFGEAADVALTYGRTLASRFGATLHVLYVAQDVSVTGLGAESYAWSIREVECQVEESARKQLAERLTNSDKSGPRTIPVVIIARSPALAIVNYAKNHEVDLIVMGTHGRGALAHLIMGSVAERVVRLADCPVLTVHHLEHEFIRPDALAAVAWA